ncbi:DUF2165 domain-containing protein [Lacihabitans sp. LS3-19]|uniref:DUF2165 family protein n=1 Tax=Lacihabitans sp. LS3-19 TaxID=2487335 RepID=UPI0020CEEE0C|nr:DUF2165 domain-containing protein [Lacihabitans sp. LS3-19]MCP9769669.1 DUF2165 domain-containing protein [Lacihabitans sp. LS3-19]
MKKDSIFAVRLVKIMMLAGISILALLVTMGNITDYYSNFYFVEHVLKMDTTFPQNELKYRSIQSATVYHSAYILLILLEGIMAIFCFIGVSKMISNLKKSKEEFQNSKVFGIYGLGIGIVIWFIGFEVIGGEWFAMWQSTQWNGLGSADRIVTFITLSLIFICQKD